MCGVIAESPVLCSPGGIPHPLPRTHARTHTPPASPPTFQAVRALVKTFGIAADRQKLAIMRETVAAIWGCFDVDGGGGIDRAEFLLPNDGLADTIIASTSFL